MSGEFISERELKIGEDLSLRNLGDDVLLLATPGDASSEVPGGVLQASGVNAASPCGALAVWGVNEEEITLKVDSATTDSTANLLPANSFIEAVVVRCTEDVGTAANFDLGDASQLHRFLVASTKVSAGDTDIGTLHLNPAVASDALGPRQTAAAKLRITCNATPDAGKLRVAVFYRTYSAPTS